ncbi:hypothetical protein ACFOU2_22235 [Bacillus songklensis]|uniref:Lipoprotein n=1 Tax=Bacillus songklensis TaxID=1069116 RepID=A0ABV8B6U6_9BACI
MFKKLLIVMTVLVHMCLSAACAPPKDEPEKKNQNPEEPKQADTKKDSNDRVKMRMGDEKNDKKEDEEK